jgi:hypothetical protein
MAEVIVQEVQGEAHQEIEGRLTRLEAKVFRVSKNPKKKH